MLRRTIPTRCIEMILIESKIFFRSFRCSFYGNRLREEPNNTTPKLGKTVSVKMLAILDHPHVKL